MKKNQLLTVFLLIGIIMVISCAPPQPKGTLVLTKTEFAPNEEIELSFTSEGTFGSNAWIGIIPSSVPHGDETKNDEFDIAYQYFEGGTSGKIMFTAPAQPGDFDFRMHNTDDSGIEVSSISFKVVAPLLDATISTNKTEYDAGEEIIVTFTAPYTLDESAWIGLIPSEIPHGSEADNDAADVAYDYIKKRHQGTMTFTAPDKKGSWDLRMNSSDSDGKEIASVTITVK
jgi:hypothetical protein